MLKHFKIVNYEIYHHGSKGGRPQQFLFEHFAADRHFLL